MVNKYENLKCGALLTRIDKNIKLLKYSLSRVVTSYKNYHIVIPTNLNSSGVYVDLIEGTHIYLKVDTANRMPPLKITVEHKDAETFKATNILKRAPASRSRRKGEDQ